MYDSILYLLSTVICLIGAVIYIVLVLQFDVADQDGNVSPHDSILPVEPVKQTETYSLEDEHRSITSDGGDEDKFVPRCELPSVQLSQKPLPLEPEPEPPAMPMGLVDKLMQQHHTNADILYFLGRDSCREYKLSRAPAVLARVRKGNKTCSICSRVLASTQSLCNHIRRAHIDETCYKCDKCGKSFGDSYVLQVHLKKHQMQGLWQSFCHSGPQKPIYGSS